MIVNPYSKKTVVVAQTGKSLDQTGLSMSRSGKVVAGGSAFENAAGEINASDKKDALGQIIALGHAAQQGNIQSSDHQEFLSKRAELVQAAIEDQTGDTWRVVGEVLGDQIMETMGRDGFTRKVLMRKDLKKGEIGRIMLRKKDVVAFMAVNDSGTVTSQVNQSYILPDEFYIKAHILIQERELEQAPGDLLDDKYIDGLEQMMVKEDQTLKILMDNAAPSYNTVLGFTTFTPTVFSQAVTQIQNWGNPCSTGILSFDLLNDIRTDPEFSTYFDPVTKREIIMSGSLGSMYGVNLITDGFRYDTLRVLNAGEFYFLAPPNVLGFQTVRRDVTTSPVNLHLLGKPERGWFMHKILGMGIGNGRALVRGVRV